MKPTILKAGRSLISGKHYSYVVSASSQGSGLKYIRSYSRAGSPPIGKVRSAGETASRSLAHTSKSRSYVDEED